MDHTDALPTREQAIERLTSPGAEFELFTVEDGHQPPLRVSEDGKSIVMTAQNSPWVWTFTPTAK